MSNPFEMKNLNRILLTGILVTWAMAPLKAQCVPDTVGCVDVDEPGQMCPRVLPEATVGVPYEVTLTIIPPDTALNAIALEFITLDNVGNIPPGLTYEANADTFFAHSTYCVLIHGTPEEAGTDTLAITVTAFAYFLNSLIPIAQVTDDTSVVVTVHAPAGFDPAKTHEFHLMPNIPNPFAEATTIGFYTPSDEPVELEVYNILGKRIYEEKQGFPPGENYFEFDGAGLQPGTYIFRISTTREVFTGKIVKVRN
jgi:hypothetical protein